VTDTVRRGSLPIDLPPDVPCALYRFKVRDPGDGYRTRRLGYVGETARFPLARLMEHIAQQPWADTIVSWEVDDTDFAGKDAVLAAEEAAIKAEKPLYNVEHNLANPDRITRQRAAEQRRERSRRRARDESPWVPATGPNPAGSPVRNRPRPSRPVPRRLAPVPSRLGTVWRWLSATVAFRAFVWWLLLALAGCVGKIRRRLRRL
jgi:hypothetical protein